jgi:hypothetical protein
MAKRRRIYRDEFGHFAAPPVLYRDDRGRFRKHVLPGDEREILKPKVPKVKPKVPKGKSEVPKGKSEVPKGKPEVPKVKSERDWELRRFRKHGSNVGYAYFVEVVCDGAFSFSNPAFDSKADFTMQVWQTKVVATPEEAKRELIKLLQLAATQADEGSGFAVIRVRIIKYTQDENSLRYEVEEKVVKTPPKRTWIHGPVPF